MEVIIFVSYHMHLPIIGFMAWLFVLSLINHVIRKASLLGLRDLTMPHPRAIALPDNASVISKIILSGSSICFILQHILWNSLFWASILVYIRRYYSHLSIQSPCVSCNVCRIALIICLWSYVRWNGLILICSRFLRL